MKKIKQLLLPFLLAICSIAISQNNQNEKPKVNQAKPELKQSSTNSAANQQQVKPANSISTEHPKVVDKKNSVVQKKSQNNK